MLDLSFNTANTRAALVFSHPTGNIVTAEIVTELRAAIGDLAESRHLKLLTIAGAGADFSFGASIPEHAPGAINDVLPEFHALIMELLGLPVPTAAVVQGRCLGGGFEIALACDFIVAADSATFGLPEIALGVFPPAACLLLPRRVGFARATSAVLSGEAQPASHWHALGLIEWMAPAGALTARVEEWFERVFAPRSAEALRHALRGVRRVMYGSIAREMPVIEKLYLEDLMRTHDAAEGIQAFLEKRPPHWKDE